MKDAIALSRKTTEEPKGGNATVWRTRPVPRNVLFETERSVIPSLHEEITAWCQSAFNAESVTVRFAKRWWFPPARRNAEYGPPPFAPARDTFAPVRSIRPWVVALVSRRQWRVVFEPRLPPRMTSSPPST